MEIIGTSQNTDRIQALKKSILNRKGRFIAKEPFQNQRPKSIHNQTEDIANGAQKNIKLLNNFINSDEGRLGFIDYELKRTSSTDSLSPLDNYPSDLDKFKEMGHFEINPNASSIGDQIVLKINREYLNNNSYENLLNNILWINVYLQRNEGYIDGDASNLAKEVPDYSIEIESNNNNTFTHSDFKPEATVINLKNDDLIKELSIKEYEDILIPGLVGPFSNNDITLTENLTSENQRAFLTESNNIDKEYLDEFIQLHIFKPTLLPNRKWITVFDKNYLQNGLNIDTRNFKDSFESEPITLNEAIEMSPSLRKDLPDYLKHSLQIPTLPKIYTDLAVEIGGNRTIAKRESRTNMYPKITKATAGALGIENIIHNGRYIYRSANGNNMIALPYRKPKA